MLRLVLYPFLFHATLDRIARAFWRFVQVALMHFISCVGKGEFLAPYPVGAFCFMRRLVFFWSALMHFVSCGGTFFALCLIGLLGEHFWPRLSSSFRTFKGETLYLGVASPWGRSHDGCKAFVLLESRSLGARLPRGCFPRMHHWVMSITKQWAI